MRLKRARGAAVVGALGLAVVWGAGQVPAIGAEQTDATAPDQAAVAADQAPADEVVNPLESKRRALREEALADVLSGTAKVQTRGASKVVKLGREASTPAVKDAKGRTIAPATTGADQYVELAREKTDKIFVILAEFGNERHPSYPDQDTDKNTGGPTRFDGPLHNEIPQPDRTTDNHTNWEPDYSADYFRKLYFGTEGDSVKKFYEAQSSGRYSVEGQVTDWVKVPYNEARYGRSNGYPCAGNVCSNTWALIRDGINAWVQTQHDAGKTDEQIKAGLASYDVWDRYDHDHDGNFNEPDGYLDHFQIVHSGGDQADGDPFQGEDAIWSHRWYNFSGTTTGPDGNKLGGSQIGTTGLWVGDYTIQPENGGLSVFAHEYGHDLGLPDHYDTAGGQDPVAWWTVMAQSRAGAKGANTIGAKPQDFGTWDKLQLGWLDYETVVAGQDKKIDLGPGEYHTDKAQGVVVVLPKKKVTHNLVPPYAGAKSWWGGQADKLNTTLSRQVTLPAGSAELSFQANYDIEDCGPDPCDYAYVEVDDGTGYKSIPGSITKSAEGNGIDGKTDGKWVPATFDLTPYAGKTIGLRFHYTTDSGVSPVGFFADDIKVTAGGTTVLEDGAENGDNGWTATGFSAAGDSYVTEHDNFYLASNYTYTSYDQYLQYGPYNYVGADRPNWVEHFPYQNGLLVSYWDTSQNNNQTSVHPGEGKWLPIDANPEEKFNLSGAAWRSRIQNYDATFGLEKSDSFNLTVNGQTNYVRGLGGRPVFDDLQDYWFPDNVQGHGVKVPHAGVKIKVLSQSGTSMRIRVFS